MIYEKKVNIGYSTIGRQGSLKIVSIMNLLQDAASEHSFCMGVSGFDLAKENLFWVVARYHIEIINHPAWQDKIAIRTGRFSCKNLYEIRNFIIMAEGYDAMKKTPDGDSRNKSKLTASYPQREEEKMVQSLEEPLITARSCWVMVNKKNGRPVRLSRFMDRAVVQSQRREEPSLCQNIESLLNDCGRSHEGIESYFKEVINPENIHYQLSFKVKISDLDLNGHVNNAVFVEWAMETVPEGIISRFSPASIDVVFNKESLYGDTIISCTEIREKSGVVLTFHSIIRQQDQAELASLNICWHPLEPV